ncbi:Nif3-like dinuclear metal center hexameric protein [uncultured Sphaerochaeta sp.]|uniref:Nif3-like dinuclear metal center hexameric protein n=1 Tax=uncultured Sphaerochaeta sp. TaxID=886478 RepID=UPI0037487636
MKRDELTEYLDGYLDLASFNSIDPSSNGLVVGGSDKTVKRIAFAVDACLKTFSLASEAGSDLLIVHHGLFWGAPIPVTKAHYTRIKTLLDNNLDLYAAHLPLDGHPEVGNNVVMARLLGLDDIQPFAPYKGKLLGFKGISPVPLDPASIAKTLGFSNPVILPFGNKEIRTIGIVSGGASDDVYAALDEGLDCFITGECEHQVYNDCLENKITLIAGGHYLSEVFGVQALSVHLQERFGVETVFLDNPTGL